MLKKILRALSRDLKHDVIYGKAVGICFMVAFISALAYETYPGWSILAGVLAALIGISFYFLRHSDFS